MTTLSGFLENMNNCNPGAITPLYQEKTVLLADADGKLYFREGEKAYLLSSHPAEPCLFIHLKDGTCIAIHNSFTTSEIYTAAQNHGIIHMVTGNDYDIKGVCRLLREAVRLAREWIDIHYLEGCCFIEQLKEQGAVSPETAADLGALGLKNHKIMGTFIRLKRVGRTDNGMYYVPRA